MVESSTIEALTKALSQDPQDTNNTYSAIVSKVDNEQIVWVQIAGSDKETPTASTSTEVSQGDYVNVQWRNNKLYIVGNSTNPAAGAIRVNAVEQAAQVANQAAANAVADAGIAREAAESAQATAKEIEGIAVEAQTSADEARTSADDAQKSATEAFNHLSVVENIVGVLNMVAEHGEYSENPSTDTTAQPEKWYFVRSGSGTEQEPYTYEIVQNAQDDYIYFLTEDTEIVEGKTYYTRSGSGTEQDPYVYTPVENPDVQYISTYYERTNSPNLHGWYELVGIDKAIQNYVINHLALDNAGLWLQSDGAAKILLSTTSGIVLYDDSNNELASYGSTTVIGNKQDFHIEIGRYYALTADEVIVQGKTYYTRTGTYPNYVYTEVQSPDVSEISTYYELMAPQIGFYQGENKVAYMGSSELYVENNLSFGNFVFTQRENGHFTLRLIG